jgi:hypothetical protein
MSEANGTGPIPVGHEPPPMHGNAPAHRTGTPPSKAKEKHSSRGRFEAINAFLDVTAAGLDRCELVVWLLLWRDTKPNGLARTSQGDLARRAGCAPRSVRRALVTLEQAGLVSIVKHGGLPARLSVYRVKPLRKDAARALPDR